MSTKSKPGNTPAPRRAAPLDLDPDTFRVLGHRLVDRLADHLATLANRPVTRGETPAQVRALLGDAKLPERGMVAEELLDQATDLVFDHSLHNGHPRFFGYITSSSSPIGALADLLAGIVNPNVGAFTIAPIGTEIECQTLRWVAELVGFPATADGVLVSGGNMANIVCFVTARRAQATWDVRAQGLTAGPRLRVYASTETHTWIQKACDMTGLGGEALRSIPVGDDLRIDVAALARAIDEDRARGDHPFLVVGNAGTVSTGAIDPLPEMAALCRERGLWFHADGAYGALAAMLPDAPADLAGIALADSVAVDPHKWLYAPLEAGCALVREPGRMAAAFGFRPPYYHFADPDEPVNFFERGPQNSRAFRALKVWLGIRLAGREGYRRMLADDIRLAGILHERVAAHPRLQSFTRGLSIVTFRYVPEGLAPGTPATEEYLNALNTELLTRIQASGRAYPSNAVIRGAFLLRACVVNFRTDLPDVEALPGIVAEIGEGLDREMRPAELAARR